MNPVRGFYMLRMEGHKKANFQSGSMWIEVEELEDIVRFKMDYVEKLEGNKLDLALVDIYEMGNYIKKEEEHPLNIMAHLYYDKEKGMQVCPMSEDEPKFVEFVQEWYKEPIETLKVVGAYYTKVRGFYSEEITLEDNIVTMNKPHQNGDPFIEAVELVINGKKERMNYQEYNPYLQDRFNSIIEFSNDMQRSVEIKGRNAAGEKLTVYEAIGKSDNECVIFDEFGLYQGIVVYLDKPDLFKLYGFEIIDEMTVYLDGKKQDIVYDLTKDEDLAHLEHNKYFENNYDMEMTGYEVRNYRKVTTKDITLKYGHSIKDDKKENGILVSLIGRGFQEEHIQELGTITYK